MMDADERALLAAIIAHPDEDTPRLIYADWLQEHDQPEYAEYIRLSIQLANLRYGEPDFETNKTRVLAQRRPLVERCRDAWHDEFAAQFPANKDVSFIFERGFVNGVWCSVKYFLDNADAFFRAAPLRSIGPRNLTATTAKRLVNSQQFRRLKEIKFFKPENALALLGCPSIEIDTLDCSTFLYLTAGDWDVVAVATAAHAGLKSVKRINFENCGMGDVGGQALADSPHLNPDTLNLLTNELTKPVKIALRKRYGPRVWIDAADRNGFPRRI